MPEAEDARRGPIASCRGLDAKWRAYDHLCRCWSTTFYSHVPRVFRCRLDGERGRGRRRRTANNLKTGTPIGPPACVHGALHRDPLTGYLVAGSKSRVPGSKRSRRWSSATAAHRNIQPTAGRPSRFGQIGIVMIRRMVVPGAPGWLRLAPFGTRRGPDAVRDVRAVVGAAILSSGGHVATLGGRVVSPRTFADPSRSEHGADATVPELESGAGDHGQASMSMGAWATPSWKA